jgi:quercetin dioxygenase-like cupin family protein
LGYEPQIIGLVSIKIFCLRFLRPCIILFINQHSKGTDLSVSSGYNAKRRNIQVFRITWYWKHREESTMSNGQVAPETKGVTVKLLTTVDLGPEIEGLAGRQLRMRMVTIEPGGVFGPIHDHKDRPGTVYILQGTITDHRNGVATDYGPGVGWPEDRNTLHWLENRGTIPAVEISVDIVRQG